MMEISKKAADILKKIVLGKSGKKDIEKLISEMPNGRWMPLKGYNSLSAVSTGELPAVTELMMNSIDAHIRLKVTEYAEKNGLAITGPEFDVMFRSPRHVTEELFGIPNGQLAEWHEHEQAWLASRIGSVILELGSGGNCKANPTVKIVDHGIGQPGNRFMDTFLNSTEGDKTRRPWEAGFYGLGSIIAARVCPYQVVVSKRASIGSSDESWAILIIRTVPSDDGEMLECSALVYGEYGTEEFATLSQDAELHVDETYFVSHHKKHLSKAEIVSMTQYRKDRYERSRGMAVEMRCEILEPTKTALKERGIVERARFVAKRPLQHGTIRILVDTTFSERWARQPLGGASGVFNRINSALPDPILPFLLVENRLSPGVASIETGERNAIAMFGRMSPLTKAADRIVHIPIDDIKIDGLDMGGVDVTMYYTESAGGFPKISGELGQTAELPRLFRSGQDVGEGNTHDFVTMIGFSKFTNRFACIVSIDRLRTGPERMSKICSAGRSCDGKAVPKLWQKVVSAVCGNTEIREIRKQLMESMPTSDALAKQISRILGGVGDGTDGESILSGSKRVPVCVKGTDMPKDDDSPEYVWIDREPKFAGVTRSLETLKPVKVYRGKPCKLAIATSSRRKINFAKKNGQYSLEVFVDGGSGADVKVVGNNLIVTVNRVSKNPKLITVVVYATDGSGFKSVPGVVKVLPAKPKSKPSRPVLLPEPTFVRINPAFANTKLPVGEAEMVRFSSDAEQAFSGFKGEVRQPDGQVHAVHIEYIGGGRGRAFVPAMPGPNVGDICLLSITAETDGCDVVCCSAELVVVMDKPAVGEAVLRRNEISKITAPGEEKGGLEIVFQDERGQYGLKDEDSEGGIVEAGGKLLGVVNRLAPSFVTSMKGVREERGRERGVAGKEALDGLEREYYNQMFMAIRDIETEAIEANPDALGVDIIPGARRDSAVGELRRVARCTGLMRVFDPESGKNYRRYVKYADDPTEKDTQRT